MRLQGDTVSFGPRSQHNLSIFNRLEFNMKKLDSPTSKDATERSRLCHMTASV